ncbi:SRPBCC family protein [Sphingobacterium psychroaquaticum]|uniref:Carbon monoxide dehydrogenase subunit G n=1 Tax=Sphingobacterium psychroaquaticum TaxID=561061 RepID=A0A1X7LD43_9SPHI|nr:SRPBCC family protein [Sphingobacterium psychroaquaticum]QBQ40412.1 SRPBCC family protein [Sphingobacterium psychroaquaticum]SMG51089.1 Carbon monoxide dehydrogenase subunit G [Sphingobacterium psychroaquaticum]
MTIIQNNTAIHKPIAAVYAFLSDLNNHEQLMPDNIYNWTSTVDEARFTIKNMAKLALKISDRVENKEIVCIPSEEAPFAITLRWKLEEQGAEVTNATFVIEAELNMMMKMMASGPLQKLVDHQVNRLKEILG